MSLLTKTGVGGWSTGGWFGVWLLFCLASVMPVRAEAPAETVLRLGRDRVLSWNAPAGEAFYTVERTTNIAGGPWSAIAGPFRAGPTNSMALAEDDRAAYYRLQVEPVPTEPAGMKYIPGGEFLMGDSFRTVYAKTNERPAHVVRTTGFFMDIHEMTNERLRGILQWALNNRKVAVRQGSVAPYVGKTEGNDAILLILKGPSWSTSTRDFQLTYAGGTFQVEAGKENHPAIGITWYGAMAFGNYLSDMQGLNRCVNPTNWAVDLSRNGFRPPTEAEWEKAARGGVPNTYFPWVFSATYTLTTKMANYTPVGLPHNLLKTLPVGSFDGVLNAPAPNMTNGFGLYDMGGNVREWCIDRFSETWFDKPESREPDTMGPSTGTERVQRGGSWDWDQGYMRCSARDHQLPYETYWFNGLRLVRRP